MEVVQTVGLEEPQGKTEEDAKVEESAGKAKTEESDIQNVKKSKEEKRKKKDDKSIDQVLKALSTLGTSEEKLAAICKKYADIVEENRKMLLQVKQSEKRNIMLQREKDQIQAEQSKTLLTRSRLENLCRELQRQNKAIKEESVLKIREEEEKRKVVSAKFQIALGEITTLIQQDNENNSKLRDENLEMQNKFKTLCEQYELREQQVEKMSKQMQLESQLSEMKLAKIKIDMFAEKELLANEKEQLLVELSACQNKCQKLQKTEAALRNQITMYNEKYDEFQSALAKSNRIYSGFKCEMEKMSKKISKLEKETSVWKMKWEGSHKALLQMAAEKQQRDAELALTTRQLNQLQKLCRTLQGERTSLINQLKNEGKTPKVDDVNSEPTSTDELLVKASQEQSEAAVEGASKMSSVDESENDASESKPVAEPTDDGNTSKSEHVENHVDARSGFEDNVDTEATPDNKTCCKIEDEGSENVRNAAPVTEERTGEGSTEAELPGTDSQDCSMHKTEKQQDGKKKNLLKSDCVSESKKGKNGSKKKKK